MHDNTDVPALILSADTSLRRFYNDQLCTQSVVTSKQDIELSNKLH